MTTGFNVNHVKCVFIDCNSLEALERIALVVLRWMVPYEVIDRGLILKTCFRLLLFVCGFVKIKTPIGVAKDGRYLTYFLIRK